MHTKIKFRKISTTFNTKVLLGKNTPNQDLEVEVLARALAPSHWRIRDPTTIPTKLKPESLSRQPS
jgi:hypothetical protein